MSVIKLVQGDNRPYIRVTLTNADGSALDVSTATVVVLFRQSGTTTVLATLTCTKPNGGSDGLVQFYFPGTTLSTALGSYEGEIQITFADATVQTIFDTLKFYVRQQF